MAAEGRGRAPLTARRSRFNGAAAGWPRKVAAGRPPFAPNSRFNGAAAGWPRKADAWAIIKIGTMQLQWGRGRMAAEGGKGRLDRRRSPRRFNGAAAGWPRKGGHANAGLRGNAGLQWGRGRMAAEGGEYLGRRFGVLLLQWGRGRMAAEGTSGTGRGQEGGDASMGPRPDGRGRSMTGHGRTYASKCFNGAAAGWPRKVAKQGPFAAVPPGLQWGRGRMAAEGCGIRRGLRRHDASMGPRPDGRGRRICSSPSPNALCFNGAAAGWPRKAPVIPALSSP